MSEPAIPLPFRLRFAQEPDVNGIVRLINTAFRVERFFIERNRTNPQTVRAMMMKGRILLAEDESGLAGCIYLELRGERGYFGLLSVDPSRQRCGLGRRLVLAAEDYFRQAGCRFSDMRIVNLRAELPEFYRRLGYAPTGTEPFTADVQPKLACHFINFSKPL